MTRLLPLAHLRAPLGGQEIELQQIDFDGGGMSLLRTRIREKNRFTIFDIDPLTAEQWGRALLDWVASQPTTPGAAGPAGDPPQADRPA
jgi:hypothetical protein